MRTEMKAHETPQQDPESGAAPDSQRRLQGGIDEAGLGPILGPLVVGGMLIAGASGTSPWDLLADHYCKKPVTRQDRRIRVDDSKKVKTGAHGHRELERTVLSLWYAVHGQLPANVGDLLRSNLGATDFTRYPWYADLEAVALPRWQERDGLELAAHVAAKCFARSGLEALFYGFHLVDVERYNASIREFDNKGRTLFEAGVPVLRACLETAERYSAQVATAQLRIIADRHGGRGHYAAQLARALPGTQVTTIAEAASLSRYRLGQSDEIVFTENGEDRAFPCAAASCLAKYVRELCIERLNAYFTAKKEGLRPTAGYWTDGKRFLDDLGDLRAKQPEDRLVRVR